MVRLNWSDSEQRKQPPKAWVARSKWLLNELLFRLLRKRPIQIAQREYFDIPGWQRQTEHRWQIFSRETNFPAAIALLALCLGLTFAWKLADSNLTVADLWPEMGGMTLDVFFILIVFAWFEHRRSERQEIQRQHETIDDLKSWDSPEAHQRIAGAIRRLNRKGVNALDLRGAVLSDFSFAGHRIENIAGSIFYDGNWGVPTNETGIRLTRVAFDWTDCSGVQFSPFEPIGGLSPSLPRYARLTDCTFLKANLRSAKFNGASLKWTSVPPEAHEAAYEDEEGEVHFEPLSYGPFHEAHLDGASFRACVFVNADFRGATRLETVDFFRAEGLEGAQFDTPEIKAQALASALRAED